MAEWPHRDRRWAQGEPTKNTDSSGDRSRPADQVAVHRIDDPAEVRRVLIELSARAEREVCSALPGGPLTTRDVQTPFVSPDKVGIVLIVLAAIELLWTVKVMLFPSATPGGRD